MSNTDVDQKKRIKAMKALDFLRNHPAFDIETYGDSLFDGAWFMMAKCCKRGYTEDAKKMGIQVYRGSKGWAKYKDRFEKEYKDDDCEKSMQSIDVPYKEHFGEPWVFDHVEYWYETIFFAYEGRPYGDTFEHIDYKKWGRYGGPQGGAKTFEDMVINCASKVKRHLGNFSTYDFYTEVENKNHKEIRAFNCKEIKSGKNKGCYNLNRNKEHLEVRNGLLNLRWLKWFIETDYCKKNWDYNIGDFKKLIKKLDKIPVARQRILDKYK